MTAVESRTSPYLPNTLCDEKWEISTSADEIICQNHITRLQIQPSVFKLMSKCGPQPSDVAFFIGDIKALSLTATFIQRVVL